MKFVGFVLVAGALFVLMITHYGQGARPTFSQFGSSIRPATKPAPPVPPIPLAE